MGKGRDVNSGKKYIFKCLSRKDKNHSIILYLMHKKSMHYYHTHTLSFSPCSLIINHSIDSGTQLPYIEMGMEVSINTQSPMYSGARGGGRDIPEEVQHEDYN